MSEMEQDAERVANRALDLFAAAWHRNARGYPGGTMAFLANHVDKSIADAAEALNVSGGAVMWAHEKFATKAQAFLANPDESSPPRPATASASNTGTTQSRIHTNRKWWRFWTRKTDNG